MNSIRRKQSEFILSDSVSAISFDKRVSCISYEELTVRIYHAGNA